MCNLCDNCYEDLPGHLIITSCKAITPVDHLLSNTYFLKLPAPMKKACDAGTHML
jgi:hypothetical protein